MADIFLSYASEDRDRVGVLVELLEQDGHSVWWDRQIGVGDSFERRIDEAIVAARVVVVVWTRFSVASRWVLNEALEGLERNLLVPVQLDEVRVPVAFRSTSTSRMIDWPDTPRTAELAHLRATVAAMVAGGRAPVAVEQSRPGASAESTLSTRVARKVIDAILADHAADAGAAAATPGPAARAIVRHHLSQGTHRSLELAAARCVGLGPSDSGLQVRVRLALQALTGEAPFDLPAGADAVGALDVPGIERWLRRCFDGSERTDEAVLLATLVLLPAGLADAALPLLEAVRDRQPLDVDAMLATARARAQTGDQVGARELVEHALELAPDNRFAQLLAWFLDADVVVDEPLPGRAFEGLACAVAGDHRTALARFEEAIEEQDPVLYLAFDVRGFDRSLARGLDDLGVALGIDDACFDRLRRARPEWIALAGLDR